MPGRRITYKELMTPITLVWLENESEVADG